jgi:hypothetical protein
MAARAGSLLRRNAHASQPHFAEKNTVHGLSHELCRKKKTTASASLSTVVDCRNTLLMGAMAATKKLPSGFCSVPDDSAAAVGALGCQRVYSAFKAIKIVRDAVHDYFQCFVVFVAANFTFFHNSLTLTL